MMVSTVSAAQHAQAPATSRSSDDATGSAAESFAGVLASLMNTPASKEAAPVAQADGTSELDQDNTTEDTDPGSVGENATPAAVSTNDVIRSLAALDPQLQSKLARVASRVQDETGHSVTVTETWRSQSRQNALFAQGRRTPGEVVTWTQNSKHTQGRAVDVALDGGAATPEAYRILQRIANEEGLRTLGPRDPGHLELPGNGGKTTPAIPTEPADASGLGGVSSARVAEVAKVAEVKVTMVARPAKVAEVAQVAQPGVAALKSAQGGRSSDTNTGSGTKHSYNEAGVTFGIRMPSHAPDFATTAVSATPSDAVARAERVMSAMDSAPARPLSHITMNVDAGNGTTDRVHVALRGSSLTTNIDTTDGRAAQLMNARADELSKALGKEGIELSEFRARVSNDNAVAATTGSQSSQGSGDASSHSRFDRGNAWQQQQDQQDRQRAQRNAERYQQRQRNGGQ
jgi:uncharacterized protein YcbK (DUF882 family)